MFMSSWPFFLWLQCEEGSRSRTSVHKGECDQLLVFNLDFVHSDMLFARHTHFLCSYLNCLPVVLGAMDKEENDTGKNFYEKWAEEESHAWEEREKANAHIRKRKAEAKRKVEEDHGSENSCSLPKTTSMFSQKL